jgi:hypothetical protein
MQFHKASLYKISNCFDYDMDTFMAQMLDNLCALADKVIHIATTTRRFYAVHVGNIICNYFNPLCFSEYICLHVYIFGLYSVATAV